MPRTVKKSSKTAKSHKPVHHKKSYSPHESMIIQGGIVFIIVSAIALFGYVMAMYGVLK